MFKQSTLAVFTCIAMAAGLLGFAANANAATALTLTDVSGKNTTNPEDIQCIIYGNSCPSGQQGMSAENYAQNGSTTSWDVTAGPNNHKGQGESTVMTDYTVGYLAGFVGKVFSIGIDVNTAGGQPPEILDYFNVFVDGTLAFQYIGPGSLDPQFNGNGYFDFILSLIDLSSFADTAKVQFEAIWHQASDGPENFFVFRNATYNVPEPGSISLVGAGLLLLGLIRVRRRTA